MQNWQKPFNVEIYRNIKLLVLPFLRTHARQINSKATLTIFYYINTPSFKKSFIQRRLKLKSEECRSALPDWKQSNPYNKIGVHLVLTSSKVIFYASALCALTRCPSVRLCPSITSRSSIETDEGDWYWWTVSQQRDPLSLEKGHWPHALATQQHSTIAHVTTEEEGCLSTKHWKWVMATPRAVTRSVEWYVFMWSWRAMFAGVSSSSIGVNSYWAQGLKPPPTFMIMGLAYMTSPPLLWRDIV